MDECKKHLSFKERELVILRETIDKIDEEKGRQLVETPSVKRMVEILERFLRNKKLICYGGTAINNILPEADQFYDRRLQIPDYDFFSKTPVDDAKELADIYAKEGFDNVEAKAGVHYGTYKVFVDFIPIADITLLDKRLFNNLFKDSIRVNGIYYTPPNYLRMSMYLELSRPAGDVSRWKVLIDIFQQELPIEVPRGGADVFFRRADDFGKDESEEIYDIAALADQGGLQVYASSLLSKYMPAKFQDDRKQPDFDVLSLRPEETATIVQERLSITRYATKVVEHKGLGEVIPPHYEVRIGHETVAFVYEPIACHSYNEIDVQGMRVKVASIDTILSLYLAFLYADRKYYDQERILCMASFLFDVQRHNRLAQKGLLKRFPSECYGEQHTIDTIRTEKAEMWNKLKDKRGTREYEEWFLNYKPNEEKRDRKANKSKSGRTRKHKGGSKSRKMRAKCNTTRRHRR